ncbi:aminotransferase class I/II-fold pyridoxal phosphate-dependent enzyme [Microbacterium sp. JB110]|uniref:aminotransferase class I/II-fold pyridoxal phosphate-dependent enzyme n=1 Tax=Microbacterium sp. JB110 TaxID=2024477 RepID=UPI00097EE53F|nr:aminotransferase class I/II-fold pyridoxal phosphate-dependent enzyme [Microbacterium sp. JB110]RCS61870.1 aminotransferase class I/II-fold pyridoxal phosphate-dependent enzyme [Microbacterium sp. JB110]SJM66338.1 Aspartate aminotransferase [Frigoribacterium sp. JB110]
MAAFSPAGRVTDLPGNFFADLDRRIASARAAGTDVIDLSKGNPDLPTPDHIVRAAQLAVADPAHHRYGPFQALPDLGDAIAARYLADHGVEVDPARHVAVFHGSLEGFMSAVLALVNPGDTLVVPDPGYPAYREAASLAGAEVATIGLDAERGYAPDPARVGADRAAAMLLNYPHNPTGAVADAETFETALTVSERLGAAFLHDFAYGSIGFDGPPLSALAVDGSFERTVEISTLSKTYNMAGWRIGYAVGNPSIIAAMRAYQESAYSSVFGAMHDAATAALAGDQEPARRLIDVYRRRRDIVVNALRSSGWSVRPMEGTFFIWLRVGDDDIAFAQELLASHGVAVASGSGFGTGGAGFVRLSLVHDEETLLRAIERFPALSTP